MADVKIDNKSSGLERNQGSSLVRGGDYDWSRDFFVNPFLAMRRFFGDMGRGVSTSSLFSQEHGTWWPAVDIKENDGTLVVSADLPGVKKDDLKVEVAGDALVVKGERKEEHEETQGGWHRTERSYGEFYRAIPLPRGVNADQAQAQFKDGVLEVKVPLPDSARRTSRQIPIKA